MEKKRSNSILATMTLTWHCEGASIIAQTTKINEKKKNWKTKVKVCSVIRILIIILE